MRNNYGFKSRKSWVLSLSYGSPRFSAWVSPQHCDQPAVSLFYIVSGGGKPPLPFTSILRMGRGAFCLKMAQEKKIN